jgi:predicted RecA/RadA family phage recombinase
MTVDYGAGLDLTANITACQTALAALQRLGVNDLADGPLTDAESTSYDAITGDTSRSQEWILTTCARTYTNVIGTLARKLGAAATSAGRQDAADAAAVYGVAGLPGDVASLAISRRDAGDRVATITDIFQLQALLGKAVRSGDVVLAHAIAETAITTGDIDTTNQFIDAYAALQDPAQRLWNATQRKQTGADIMTAWRLAALKPAPLKSLQDDEIGSAAAGNANAGTWNV